MYLYNVFMVYISTYTCIFWIFCLFGSHIQEILKETPSVWHEIKVGVWIGMHLVFTAKFIWRQKIQLPRWKYERPIPEHLISFLNYRWFALCPTCSSFSLETLLAGYFLSNNPPTLASFPCILLSLSTPFSSHFHHSLPYSPFNSLLYA